VRSALIALAMAAAARADDWPQWRGPQRDGVWREEGLLDRFPPEGLPVLWRAAVGAGFSGPAVSGSRVFVMDRVLDEASSTDVKTQWNYRDRTSGQERLLCLEAETGKVLWTHAWPCAYSISYGSGPRATPTVHGDRVYALGAMGDLFCLEADTGKVAWRKNYIRDYGVPVPLYGFSSAPLVDGDRLIILVGGTGQTVVALDRHTGKELWKAIDSTEPGYGAPILCTLAGRRQLLVWHSEGLAGLEPETGKTFWTVPHHAHTGMSISSPAVSGDRVAVSSQYEGALMLEFKAGAADPAVLWKASTGGAPERTWKKAGLNTTLSTVLLLDNHVYGVSLYGETCCLNGDTGERVWTTLEPTSGGTVPKDRWSSVFMVTHRDRVFIFNEKGDLILARLTPKGYEELGRTRLLEPDMASSGGGRKVIWSHPAFAGRRVYARNNHELVCRSLAAP
jgi:outer membrane protein assembly factor BamB